MAAYSIVRVDVHDAEAYQRYAELAGQAAAEFGAEFLVRGGKTVVKEGDARARNVVVKFADMATAEAFYNSPTYQEALTHGLPASTREYIIVEGV
ncbi:MAG: DUF1330 domain-containing protein [Pseudomonadota bacterium]